MCQLVESAKPRALDIARESEVSALGLKFLGPAQRFTRSRGYRLSSQEVMPSSRREYQILRCTFPAARLSPRTYSSPARAAHDRAAPQVRTRSQSFSSLRNPREFPRAPAPGFQLGRVAPRENRADYARSRDRARENIDFHFHLAPFNTDEQRPPTASGARHYLARLI